MKITSVKFYRLALLTPYLIALLLFPFFIFGIREIPVILNFPLDGPESSEITTLLLKLLLSMLMIMNLAYFVGIPIWLVPYTILATGLWIWSLKKNKSQVYKMFVWSPVYLTLLTTALYLLIPSFKMLNGVSYLGSNIPIVILVCIFPSSMGLGYFFMGIIAWVYDVFVRRGIILDEENLLNLESMRI